MVKNVVKKMHGLNTFQLTDSIRFLDSGLITGSQLTAFNYKTPDSPQILGVVMPSLTTDDQQTYLKRLYVKTTWYNRGPLPCKVRHVWVRCRRDISSDTGTDGTVALAVIMAKNAPSAANVAYVSNTTGEEFHRFFKILKTTDRIRRPGRAWTTKVKSSISRSRPVTWSNNGNTTLYHFRKGNKLLITWITGMPFPREDEPLSVQCTGPYDVVAVDHHYCSFYNLDDVTPTSIVSSVFPAVRPSVIDITPITQTEAPLIFQPAADISVPVTIVNPP